MQSNIWGRFGLGLFLGLNLHGIAEARFPVIGYFASWSAGIEKIQYSKLTHINYSFSSTNAEGDIGKVDEAQLRDLVTRAHAVGTKVGVAIGGWGADESFHAMTATANGRERFVLNAVAFCDKFGLDGIDIDWEYPLASDATIFETLCISLSTALHKKNRYLSLAVKSRDVYVAEQDVGANIKAGVFAVVDFLNCMAYDGGGAIHSPYEMAVSELEYWTKTRGCPRAKVILGVPFYGKELKPDGKETATSYQDIAYSDRMVPTRDKSGNTYYNGIATLQKKAQLASDKGGGIMIWEVAQDTQDETSLLTAIALKAATFPDIPLVNVTQQNIRLKAKIRNGKRGMFYRLNGIYGLNSPYTLNELEIFLLTGKRHTISP